MHKPEQVIAVLGMHRSGTSCLTGLLEDAGVYLGDVSKQNPYNLRGNQERLAIMELHDAVLADNQAAWDRPPTGTVHWSAAHRRRLRAIIAGYRGHRIWAFKDPRTLFTLDGWLACLPDLRCIGTFRHPAAVYRSLHNRNGMERQAAYDLWCRYNERLLHYWQRFRFPVVDFSLEPEAYLADVQRAFAVLGLTIGKDALRFFDTTLRRHDTGDVPELPREVADLLARLQAIRKEQSGTGGQK